ncbi:zinc metalloproteinase nas-14 isoform X4 [Hydra vulgaris]|uniref:Metalloendopeptidase n=1 Tax=Hydra vulgaris TaxID=6087 RepID=A0ABM4D3I0_HYDVU
MLKMLLSFVLSVTILHHGLCLVNPVYDSGSATSSPQQIPNVNFGDVLLTPQQKQALKNGEDMGGSNLDNNGYSIANGNNLRWTDAIIPYKIDCSIENLPDAVEAVTKAMAEWENKTCIRFVKRTNEKYFLEFFRDTHCWGNVGMTSYTKISVGDGCEYHHVNTHEIGHVVGFYHEQNRIDRDQWIKIHWENIAQFKDAFDIVKETSSLGVDYDYASIMHYPWNAFSSNGKDTISPIKPLNGKTPYIELSKDDIEQVSRMYNCPAIEKKRALAKKSKYFGDVRERRNANDCVDKNKSCPDWAKAGYCTTNQATAELCKLSCKSCQVTDCVDQNKYCPDWAKAGYCSTNQATAELCKLSCKSPSCQVTASYCVDQRTECPEWKSWGHCTLSTFVAIACPLSCDPKCKDFLPKTTPTSPTTGHETNPPTVKPTDAPKRNYMGIGILCRDRRDECPNWARQGECTSNSDWMNKNCAISCNNNRCDKQGLKPAGKCADPLGLSWDGKGYKIPDSALYSPDHLKPGDWEASAKNARLYFEDDHTNKRIGAWCAASHEQVSSKNGYVQVDLGSQKTINYIATQGRFRYFERVSQFKIEYSNDGVKFQTYSENGIQKKFDGNCDHQTPVLNQFKTSISARYLRYIPVESNYPCVRMEFYGC